MKKLRLDIDSIRVQSLVVDAPDAGAARGTVRAREQTMYCQSYEMDCTGHREWYTCGNSCINMCIHTMEVPGCGYDTPVGCV
jgi:hypothetical protein